MRLHVITCTLRGGNKLVQSIQSSFNQIGFDEIDVWVSGEALRTSPFPHSVKKDIQKTYNDIDKTNPEDYQIFLKKKFNTKHLHLIDSNVKEWLSPGGARNLCIETLVSSNYNEQQNDTYVLFLDDDILLPNNYASTLVNFLKSADLCACMGRLETVNRGLWDLFIDYSNFWWLQIRKDIDYITWLGAGCTLTKLNYVKDLRFRSDLIRGEDIYFFQELKRRLKKNLGICARVTGGHNHHRNFKEYLNYNYTNGSMHNDLKKIDPKRFFGNIYISISYNRRAILKNPLIAFGIILSFFITELGVLFTAKNVVKNKK